jgi:hypothetical protein
MVAAFADAAPAAAATPVGTLAAVADGRARAMGAVTVNLAGTAAATLAAAPSFAAPLATATGVAGATTAAFAVAALALRTASCTAIAAL